MWRYAYRLCVGVCNLVYLYIGGGYIWLTSLTMSQSVLSAPLGAGRGDVGVRERRVEALDRRVKHDRRGARKYWLILKRPLVSFHRLTFFKCKYYPGPLTGYSISPPGRVNIVSHKCISAKLCMLTSTSLFSYLHLFIRPFVTWPFPATFPSALRSESAAPLGICHVTKYGHRRLARPIL